MWHSHELTGPPFKQTHQELQGLKISTEYNRIMQLLSCLLIAAAAEMLLWILVIVNMLAMEATPLPSSDSCKY